MALENLVFVTEDTAVDMPGCDAISLHDASTGAAIFKGHTLTSPGRLAVSGNLQNALATFPNGCILQARPGGRDDCAAGIVTAIRTGPSLSEWASGSLVGAKFATFGGIAVVDHTSSFLVALSHSFYPDPDTVTRMRRNQPPYAVGRYRLPNNRGNPGLVGGSLGEFGTSDLVVEIVLSPDQTVAHLLLADGHIESIDLASMKRIAAPIHIATVDGPPNHILGSRIDFTHATLTGDGRYLLINRGTTPEFMVADLVERRSWNVAMTSVTSFVGGLAINRGWENSNLLAIHGRDHIIVAAFSPPLSVTIQSTIPISEPYLRTQLYALDYSGPHYAIAWTGDGSRIVAASDTVSADFTVIDVSDMGKSVVASRFLTACDQRTVDAPNDIFTLNGLLTPPPTPTSATPPPSLTPTQPPPPATTPAPPATPTPSPTPTLPPPPTASPTTVPSPIYLPIALRTRCQAIQPHVDVALVIDASSSMEAAAPSGRSKLQAAVDAASAFVRRLDLAGGDQAAVVTFNASAIVREPLSGDALALDAALASITTAQLTRIDLGLAQAREVLADGARRRAANRPVIILLTDGRSNPVPVSDAVAQADGAKRDGITVFTIGLGDDVEIEALAAMASEPDYAFVAPDADELARIYRTIASVLPCAGTGWP